MIDLSPFVQSLNGRNAAVFGLGRSGLATVRALCAAGLSPYAWDDQPEAQESARVEGAIVKPFAEWPETLACVVLAPGIPLTHPEPHPVVTWARRHGVAVIGDIEIFHQSCHGLKTIGITGTNGKSTTTALIGHVLNQCGYPVAVGGNIGVPVLELDTSGKKAIVLELSSYQLDLCPDFAPEIAVHLNLTPDHIDRHGSMDGYRAAKMRIFRGSGIAVIGVDDTLSRVMMDAVRESGQRQVYAIGTGDAARDGIYIRGGNIVERTGGAENIAGSMESAPTLKGVHNHQNAAAALMVARLAGIPMGDALEALASFPGLPHRMFKVRDINGISYINDSKATNADAASRALASFSDIYWIVGGKAKEGGLNGLEPFLPRVRHAFTIGEAGEEFSDWLERHQCAVTRSVTLDHALDAAHAMAQEEAVPGAVVLLSPACASFDQFRSFEHRGEMFSRKVLMLAPVKKTGTHHP